MHAVWQKFPSWVAGGDDAGTISGISLDDCEALCCQRYCHAINYQVEESLCVMKAFVNDIILSEESSVRYNVSLSKDFQGNVNLVS